MKLDLQMSQGLQPVSRMLEPTPATPPLSPRQLQVAQLAAEGLNDREIAAALQISVNTVGAHLNIVFVRIGLHSRSELGEHLLGIRVPLPASDRAAPSPLTPREQEVLRCFAQGLPYKLIAAKLNISPNTVNNTLRLIRSKLQVQSTVEAVVKAGLWTVGNVGNASDSTGGDPSSRSRR